MANTKTWRVYFVVGDPWSGTTTRSYGPCQKQEAVRIYGTLQDDCRKWIEHDQTGQIMKGYISASEQEWRAKSSG